MPPKPPNQLVPTSALVSSSTNPNYALSFLISAVHAVNVSEYAIGLTSNNCKLNELKYTKNLSL